MRDTPAISTMSYASNTYSPQVGGAGGLGAAQRQMSLDPFVGEPFVGGRGGGSNWLDNQVHQIRTASDPTVSVPKVEKKETKVTRRVVQVFIVDPDENVPVDQSLIYKSEEPYLTELTDQELYFEIDLKTRLDAHNEKRKKIVNKKVKERTEFLEPVKIRDLKMVVTQIATF